MRDIGYHVLIPGLPARSSRGFLGWSTVTLLETAEGPVLFDTGTAGERAALLSALAVHGLDPAQIRQIVLSHLHVDHVGNVECFPRAELIIHQDELTYFYEQQGRDAAMPTYLIEGMLARSKLQLIHGELEILRGVRLLQTPGHTGGHCSIAFSSGGRAVVLAQDAIKNRVEAATGDSIGAFDPEAARNSIRRIMSMAELVVPGHDGVLTVQDGQVVSVAGGRVELTRATDGQTLVMEF
ncbi:MAG TPA: MBL fold metallo-hydrolase [Devosiaceae bacterium]|nr:MBL fold metallo-hydrolase [Devosiaceae bacterium]